jgi:hypothetical protein
MCAFFYSLYNLSKRDVGILNLTQRHLFLLELYFLPFKSLMTVEGFYEFEEDGTIRRT